MKGCIFINSYFKSPTYIGQYTRLKEEFSLLGVDIDIINAEALPVYIKGGKPHIDYSGYEFCVFLDKDMYISELMTDCGWTLFNTHAAIRSCDDKMLTHIVLSRAGVPMPDTIPAPLCYTQNATVSDKTYTHIIDLLGLPVVVKNSFGSMGKSVYLAKDKAELKALSEELKGAAHLYQKYIAESSGKDLRVIVIGGKAIGSMLRKSQTDFRSNVGGGGKGESYPLPQKAKELAERAAKALSLDYAGVDLLFYKDDFLICEVNSNAFFEEFEKKTGINVAALYAKHIISKINDKKR